MWRLGRAGVNWRDILVGAATAQWWGGVVAPQHGVAVIIKAPYLLEMCMCFVKMQSDKISSRVEQIMAPITVNENQLGRFPHFQRQLLNVMKQNEDFHDWLLFLCTYIEACLWWIVQRRLWCLRLVWSSGPVLKPLWTRSWCLTWNTVLFAYSLLAYSYSLHLLYESVFIRLIWMKFPV